MNCIVCVEFLWLGVVKCSVTHDFPLTCRNTFFKCTYFQDLTHTTHTHTHTFCWVSEIILRNRPDNKSVMHCNILPFIEMKLLQLALNIVSNMCLINLCHFTEGSAHYSLIYYTVLHTARQQTASY